jgi:peptide/nickel transport system ATP-binding protein
MTQTTAAVLEVSHARVAFKGRRGEPAFVALDDVSLRVEAGRTMGLIGESGSGKSTLAKVVMGLVPLQDGAVTVGGAPVTHADARGQRRLGRVLQPVFQDPTGSFNPSWTIARSLAEPMRAQGATSRAVLQDRISAMLTDVGLDPGLASRHPRHFSGGQLQRIAIARALMTSPQIVVADEPVSALDLSVQAQILNLLSDLQAKHHLSFLFISHNMSVVRHVCHDTTVLYRGQVMEAGSTRTVTQDPAHPYTRALLLAAPVADPAVQRRRRLTTPAAKPVVADLPARHDGCPFATRCEFAVDRCRTERPALRAVGEGRSVACHQYPQWREQLQGALSGSPVEGTAPH